MRSVVLSPADIRCPRCGKPVRTLRWIHHYNGVIDKFRPIGADHHALCRSCWKEIGEKDDCDHSKDGPCRGIFGGLVLELPDGPWILVPREFAEFLIYGVGCTKQR